MRAGEKEKRDVPHEPGAFVEFRTLSGAELDEAEERQTKRSMALIKGLDPETLNSYRDRSGARREQTAADKYDKGTLVFYGVVGCSECDPCDDRAKNSFDAQTRDWAAGVILEMNVRPLARSSEFESSSNGANSRESWEAPTGSTLQE